MSRLYGRIVMHAESSPKRINLHFVARPTRAVKTNVMGGRISNLSAGCESCPKRD